MAPAGRPPKPSYLKILEGNPGRRPVNDKEPKPTPRRRTPADPAQLGEKGEKEWRRVAKLLTEMGIMADIDLTMLHMYCDAYDTWCFATKQLEEGMLVKTPKGYTQQSPYVGIKNRAYAVMHQVATDFGMTPAARTRIVVEPPADADEAFFFGGNAAGA